MVNSSTDETSRGFLAAKGRRGNLYIISGPSGAGKGTLVSALLERRADLQLSISCTTRPQRPGEVEGRDYYFMTEAEFQKAVEAGAFLEWAPLYGYYYGTPRDKVDESLAGGRSVVLEIDVQGAAQVRAKVPESVAVFIKPPSIEELIRRLKERGRDDEKELERRLDEVRRELEAASEYDCVIVNDRLEDAVSELLGFIERCEAQR